MTGGRAFACQRPLVSCAAAYGAGVLGGGVWRGFHWPFPLAGLACGLLAALLSAKKPGQRIASLAFCCFFLGVLLAGQAANPVLPPEGKYQVSGRVSGEAQRRETDGRITARLNDVTVWDDRNSFHVSSAYWTYYPGQGTFLPQDGQRARFAGSLYHPSPQMNPYGFDFRAFLQQRGIGAGITGARDLRFDPPGQREPESPWIRVRRGLAERFDLLLGENAGLAKALIVGLRDDLTEETVLSFRKAGVAHVLAVSGLHVSLMAGMLYAALRKLHLSPWALLGIFAALLLAYCRLLDYAPSIVRASILTLLYLLGRALKRRVDPLTSLAAAFMLILLTRPLDLFSLGFQLSFLAVLGMITLGDSLSWLYRRWAGQKAGDIIGKLAAAYISVLSASALTALPIISAFHDFSLAGLVISPLAIAGAGLLMVLYVAALVMSALCLPLVQFFAWPAAQLTRLYEASVAWIARLPAAARLSSPAWWQTLLVFGLLALGTRYVVLKARPRLVAAFVMGSLLVVLPLVPAPDPVRYIQLSAGNADSAVITDGKKTLVIDTGSHGGDLAKFLLASGRRADILLITHLHTDHAGGLEQLLEQELPIGEILLPSGAMEAREIDASAKWLEMARARGIPVKTVGSGDEIALGRAVGRVIWPHHGAAYPGLAANTNSLVTLWDLDGVSLLSTGDIGADYSHYISLSAQVMKLPHHGAKRDATQELIRRVSPQIALITASGTQPERYQAARERLADTGAAYLITGETGAVTIICQDGQAQLTSYLKGGTIHGL